MKKGLLSVIIPTYNRCISMVQNSVESVLRQDYSFIDIYIIDDNDNDNIFSNDIKKYCDEKKVHYIKQDGNKGACAARNLGIRLSQGEYLGFLDDDDTWEPTKARVQIEEFDGNIGMVYCKGLKIDTTLIPHDIKEYYNSRFFKRKITFSDLLIRDYIGSTSQVIVHKKCFDTCGGFDEELLARQDYEMWLRISRHFDIVGVDQVLFNHFIHQHGQISKNEKNSLQGYSRIYRLYKKDFKKNKRGRNNILIYMIKSAKNSKNYACACSAILKYILFNPECIIKVPYKEIKKLVKRNSK